MFKRTHISTPRPVAFCGLLERDGWSIKLYSITLGDAPLEREMYYRALELAMSGLPTPAVAERRPGVGFAIFHRGHGWHYLVLCWWDNENELPQRVFVRRIDAPDGTAFRPARDSESICVWDAQVIWFEREAYVRHVLSPAAGPDVTAYLAATLQSDRASGSAGNVASGGENGGNV